MKYEYKYASEELIKAFEGIGYERFHRQEESKLPPMMSKVHLSELQMWLLEKHRLNIYVQLTNIEDDDFSYFIETVPKGYLEMSGGSFDHPQGALSAGLHRAVEIVKERK